MENVALSSFFSRVVSSVFYNFTQSRAEFTYGTCFHDEQGNLIQIKQWNGFLDACSASLDRSNCYPSITFILTLTHVCGMRAFFASYLTFSLVGCDLSLSSPSGNQNVLFLDNIALHPRKVKGTGCVHCLLFIPCRLYNPSKFRNRFQTQYI